MQFSWLLQFLGWLSLPLLAALAVVLLWRKAYREFPVFFGYVAAVILFAGARLMAYRMGYRAYYFVYWTSDLLLSMLALVVTYDLFARRIFAGYRRVRFYRYSIPIAILVLIALTVVAAETPNRTTIFLIASRFLSLLQVALIFFFGGLMLFLNRKWTDYEIGIASGFAVSECVQLMVAVTRSRLHYRITIIDQFPAWAYDVACILWLIYCWKPPQKPVGGEIPASGEWLEEAKRWEQQLRDWFSRKHCI